MIALQARSAIRVLLVEDHRMVAAGLSLVLGEASDMEVVGIADGRRALAGLPESVQPDVVLMDFRLADGEGPQAAEEARRRWPPAAVVFLSADDSEEAVLDAVQAGARGYLAKTVSTQELLGAIRRAASGGSLIPPHISRRLPARGHRRPGAHPVDELTPREREVLDLIARGLDNKSIARSLHLRIATVRSHVQRVLEKLSAHSKLEAAALAVEHRRTACHVPAYRRMGSVRSAR